MARQRRVAGQYYAFYGALARAAQAAKQDGQELAERLHARAQDVGYTGARPTDDEMDSDLRELERLLSRYQNGG